MRTNKIIFYVGTLILAAILVATGPHIQSQGYHLFAEQRTILNIPHFGDVLSNLAFAIVGILLFIEVKKWNATEMYKDQGVLFKALAYSCIILALGSGYYHWEPVDSTLIWDRVAMVLSFTIVFYDSCIRYDVFNKNKVIKGALATAAAFLGTVVLWIVFDRLEPYYLVQAFALVLVILAIRNYKTTPSKHLFYLFGWYVVAKICEICDKQIFMLTGDLISGHTLKHIASAVALYVFGKYMLKRVNN
jgi:hypothetical protein